jgi:cellulose synthase/poly-beta-1,6-N-acetylglucosamine synthase-like glycosyltransferase
LFEFFCLALSCSLVLLAVHGWVCGLIFARRLKQPRHWEVTQQHLPKSAILMGLKGSDPDLLESLKRLMEQDYPDYELHIVVDSYADPSWTTVQRAIAETAAMHVVVDEYHPSPLTGPVNCTNAKQVQSLRKLDDSIEIVAMADGDLMAHPNWLRELVAPLVSDSTVGATYGNRWFQPERAGWGSMVRYVWNVAAVVSMYLLKMPWGGCFAIRMETIRERNLVHHWSKIIAFDASIQKDLKATGLKLEFVSSLIMPNYEECRLAFCHNFFQRQLTWTRLYHPRWNAIFVYSLIASTLPWVSLAIIAVAIALGLSTWIWIVLGLVVHYLLQWSALIWMQKKVARSIDDPKVSKWLTRSRALQILLLIPITQAIQLSALSAALICRRVKWRGLVLAIDSPTQIRMIDPKRVATNTLARNTRESL